VSPSQEPVEELFFELPIPPSANALYQRRRGGGVALSKAAKTFKEHVKGLISSMFGTISRFPVDAELLYDIHIVIYFERTENPGWFERWTKDTYVTRGKNKGDLRGRKGERKAKSRYKEIDYDNRIKFLQDCIVTAIGIPNDTQIFRGTGEKREDPDNPRAEVRIRLADRSEFFVREQGGSFGQARL
jgi:Holliday junction resolvase RusA-like endonuclease